jgi:CBS-domain-containing membrane protein
VGEALLGVGIMAGTVALVVVSFGTAFLGPGVGFLQLELLLQPTVLIELALLMVINHNKHNLFPKWMKKREGN